MRKIRGRARSGDLTVYACMPTRNMYDKNYKRVRAKRLKGNDIRAEIAKVKIEEKRFAGETTWWKWFWGEMSCHHLVSCILGGISRPGSSARL